MCNLVQKYNVPGPRYTSYPTVPYWDMSTFSGKKWEETLKQSFKESNGKDGISLYIHLPFCESICTFCGCHKRITKRHEVEVPYINSVLKEWSLYCNLFDGKPRIKELHLGGGTPTFFTPENLVMLIDGIFKRATKDKDAVFSFEGHPNNTSKTHLQALYNVGFSKVSFGIQDYNEEVQKAIHRIQPFANVKNVSKWAHEIGYTSVGHDIIYGLPFQKLEHIQETVAKTKELKPDRLAFYSYAHVPWLKGNGQRGYRDADLPSAKVKRDMYEKGKELLLQAGYHEIGMDHFALENDELYLSMKEGNLHRNFMGYTSSRTRLMVGLGVSSISDSWYSFAQNVKGLEEYNHLVDNNIIPIYRGHILTDNDQIIRSHILNLMCNFKTSWYQANEIFPELEEVLFKLKEMEKDNLIQIQEKEIEVREQGRPFIRNICMAFDMLLHKNQPEKKLFSMTI
ncbi:oxygen-independent coproporphyrinogen-3 oxidase [Saonia flava]|uniref:Coproporphyrinogen-III oxidase n=1 Tax=Saonia flava TaxID=523696 RepID=A0A846QWL3_9FLAO|nr:oxygen-independent coproporphyrinogen III oxidase [Saonia flava]NJB71330.1 oxygen-independent coproporphyrinogen-3 oxidase [Saonia flava]